MKTFEKIKEDAVHLFISEYAKAMFNKEWLGLLGLQALKDQLAGTHKGIYKMRQDVEGKCIAQIRNTDVRSIKGILTLFPSAFPAYVRSGKYSIEYGNNGFEFHPLSDSQLNYADSQTVKQD